MHTDAKGDRVGASILPMFNRDTALFLYRIELDLLFQFANRQSDVLHAAYGADVYTVEEIKLFDAAMRVANATARELDDLAQTDPSK